MSNKVENTVNHPLFVFKDEQADRLKNIATIGIVAIILALIVSSACLHLSDSLSIQAAISGGSVGGITALVGLCAIPTLIEARR